MDCYTEIAWLFTKKTGYGIEKIEEIFDVLDERGLNPYEFEEIGSRKGSIEIKDLENGFEVIDTKKEILFSTRNSSNPKQID